MIQRAMLDGLATGRIDTFNRFVQLAYSVYDKRYAASAPGTKHVSKEAQLPPFPKIVDASFTSAMKQESNAVLVRARIWAWAPEELKARNWLQLRELLASQAAAAGLDPARAFPAPPGADASDGKPAAEPAAKTGGEAAVSAAPSL
jgi:hypothetical protein